MFKKKENGYWTYSKINSDTGISLAEKSLIMILISYWKLSKYKGEAYINKSYRDFQRMMGVKRPETVTNALKRLVKRGFAEILNTEETKERRFLPKIVLKEEKINVYFKGDFFNNSMPEEISPGESLSSSTNPFRREETKVQKTNCGPAWQEPTQEQLAASLKRVAEYTNQLSIKREEQLKKKYGN